MKQLFSGSIGRLSYSLKLAGIIIASIATVIISNVTHGKFLVPALLVLLILFVGNCAITAKRLRSIGVKGDYAWLLFVPYVSIIMQILLIFWRPKLTPGNRKFFVTLITVTVSLLLLIAAYIFVAAIIELPSYLDRNHVN